MNVDEFKISFMPFHRPLYQIAFYLTGNALDAEDLLQELYLRLWLKRNELGKEKQNIAYLTSMLRNLYIDSARIMRPPMVNLDDIEPPIVPENPENNLIARNNSEHLSQYLGSLSTREREIIKLYFEEDKKYKEIKKTTGLSIGNLRVIVARTKHKIQKHFINLNKPWNK